MSNVRIFFEFLGNISSNNDLVIIVIDGNEIDVIVLGNLLHSYTISTIGNNQQFVVGLGDSSTKSGFNTEGTTTLEKNAFVLTLLNFANIQNVLSDILNNLNELGISGTIIVIHWLLNSSRGQKRTRSEELRLNFSSRLFTTFNLAWGRTIGLRSGGSSRGLSLSFFVLNQLLKSLEDKHLICVRECMYDILLANIAIIVIFI